MTNELTYLSIAKEPYSVNYAVFKGKSLIAYGTNDIKYSSKTGNILNEVYDIVSNLISKYKVDVVLSNLIDIIKYSKKELVDIVRNKTMIEYVSNDLGCLYVEFKTFGWEKRILNNVITSNNKVNTINRGYRLDLRNEQVAIADAIILGEGVAHNRLQIGKD